MSRHLITCLPEEDLSNQQLSASHRCLPHRSRGNKELSKQSNCSILQGTKVDSAKEHDQYILIPQRVIQQNSAFFSKQSYQISRKLGILQQIPTLPSSIHIFLTSIPGSLGLKIVPRRYIKHSVELLPRYSSKLPQESPI